ncbi:MAG: hypothetical protein IPF73_13850 [Betaproteobacteria bacterium]|nr:hypothetical protein [Betaproteobacteria bacterium]
MTTLANPLAEHVWRTRYRFEEEASVDATLDRVAHALSGAEEHDRGRWARRFRDALEGSASCRAAASSRAPAPADASRS